jgi:hypothetical protein
MLGVPQVSLYYTMKYDKYKLIPPIIDTRYSLALGDTFEIGHGIQQGKPTSMIRYTSFLIRKLRKFR